MSHPIKHKKLNILSFSGGNFLQEFVSTVFGGWLFFFYETEIGLNGWLITLGYMIYAIWSAISSPIFGYYTNQKTRFTKRWGKHFPWILISSFPWFISLFLVYSIPNEINTQLFIFLWFTISINLFSIFSTIFGLNFSSLFPKKFLEESERRNASGIIGAVSFMASGFGSILPALIIQFESKISYMIMALISLTISSLVMILTIPGIKEKEATNKLNMNIEVLASKSSFYANLKYALKQKNFVILIITFFCTLIIMRSAGAAFPYAVRYIFKAPAIFVAFISLAYLIGAIISMPFWTRIGNRLNNNKSIFLLAGILLAMSQLLLTIVPDILIAFSCAFFYGFCIAGFWSVLTMPINAEILDEIAIDTGQRNESIYIGIRGFFISFSVVIQSIIFASVHEITGFIENAESQTVLAQWGIRLTLAFIPMILTLISIIIFKWKYNLTPEKVQLNRKKLEELGI
jgi:GPH family glycoside/pentoside/hexuronide:cation symporter